jgi:multidrug transporter EmrE-like cation transporter
MTVHTRWVRRSLALWSGLGAAGGAATVVAYLRFRESLGPLLMATLAVVLIFGAIWTARLRGQDREPFISVEDLRRR